MSDQLYGLEESGLEKARRFDESHGYRNPEAYSSELPEYLGLIKDVQKTQEQFRSDIIDIHKELDSLTEELWMTKTEMKKISESYPSIKVQEQALNLLKDKVDKSLLIKNPDFLLSSIGFFIGSLLLICGIITNILYYAIAGMACLLLGIIHFGSIEKQN